MRLESKYEDTDGWMDGWMDCSQRVINVKEYMKEAHPDSPISDSFISFWFF